ncbi:MAG: ABC transporter ATP-binding protein [Pseudomonadota bacterium]
MTEMIEVSALSKKFGQIVAVDGVSLSVKKGEVLGFLGPNGAGKSTTMKMITGFLTPTTGTATVCGFDVAEQPMKAKQSFGYLPEGAPAYGDMTPRAFLEFIARMRGLSGARSKERMNYAIDRCNISEVLDRPIETLSKGFKRRVGLAQAIIHDPQVLILDEPTDGLDPNQKHEVRTLIQDMAAEKCIIVSTHILEEVEAVCTRAVIIARGKVVADGTPDALIARSPLHNAVTLALDSAAADAARSKISALPSVSSIEDVSAVNGEIRLRVLPKEGHSIVGSVGDVLRDASVSAREISVEQGRLEDVFRTITTDAA